MVTVHEVIKEAELEDGCPKAQGALVYQIITKYPVNALRHRPVLLKYVKNGSVSTNRQLDEAIKHLGDVGDKDLDVPALESSCGVGVEVTQEDIAKVVAQVIQDNMAQVKEEGHSINKNLLLQKVLKQPTMFWAPGSTVRTTLQQALVDLLGPEPDTPIQVDKKAKKAKAKKEKKESTAAAAAAAPAAAGAPAAEPAEPVADPYEQYPEPGENNKVHVSVNLSEQCRDEYIRLGVLSEGAGNVMHIVNSSEQLKQNLEVTGGKVVSRFPPEPNGYLHIGHSKAMFIDFGLAAARSGHCFLRFDDTNPAAEKHEYIDHIQSIVKHMGWAPARVTYSSDYFPQLYELALVLIRKGLAYVCEQSGEEIKASRETRTPSPYRGRSVRENLAEFYKMSCGVYEEGKVTLRLKMDPWGDVASMYDVVAYRVKYTPHPRTGRTWCVYPSYDYTHCLVDSLERVTHSLCTLEFETRRAQYYWLLEVLGMYKPYVKEYARLNISNNVMSKRKLNKLVTCKYVNGWDDPRLMTLAGLARRGVPAQAINTFCRALGITRNDNLIPQHQLEHHVRATLDASSPRRLGVLRPLLVVITNIPKGHKEVFSADNFPGRGGGSYDVVFGREVLIESTDFKEKADKGFYGLAPGKEVLLKYAHVIKCTEVFKDNTGTITHVHATCDTAWRGSGAKPPKGVLNWVANDKSSVACHVRLYQQLFNSDDPAELEDYVSDLNPESEEVLRSARGCKEMAKLKAGDTVQLERLGYFCVDPSSSKDTLVLNRTVTLKASVAVQKIAAAQ